MKIFYSSFLLRYFLFTRQKLSRVNHIFPMPLILSAENLEYKWYRLFSNDVSAERGHFTDISETDECTSKSLFIINDYNSITDGDSGKLKIVKRIQLELDLMAQQGEKVPPQINTKQWRYLISCTSIHQKKKYINFLWLKHMKKITQKEVKEARKACFLNYLQERNQEPEIQLTTKGPILYELRYNTIFFRINHKIIINFYNYKLFQASMFDIIIVIDMDYENVMTITEMSKCSKQLHIMLSENRLNSQPSHLLFCNTCEDSILVSQVNQIYPTLLNDEFPFFYTKKNYLDLFPKKQIVYLTPHCKEELQYFEPNTIYIIGAFVDVHGNDTYSLIKAKKEGLRMAKFPLDKYLNWNIGTKSLTLNQCVNIMNDLKTDAEWMYALRHVPKRKLKSIPIDKFQQEKRLNRETAKSIKEEYRRNIVYDVILHEKLKKKS